MHQNFKDVTIMNTAIYKEHVETLIHPVLLSS